MIHMINHEPEWSLLTLRECQVTSEEEGWDVEFDGDRQTVRGRPRVASPVLPIRMVGVVYE